MTNSEKLLIYWILGAVVLITSLVLKVKSMNVDLEKLPHVEVAVPDGYKGIRILNAGEDGLFLLHANKTITNNSYESKIFLISQDGKILDEFQASKHITGLNNIIDIGLVASDYSSPYVGGNKYFMISIKNNKIVLDKTTSEKIDLFSKQNIKDIPHSSNVSLNHKCYISIDIEYGTCTYGVTTVTVDNMNVRSSKYKISDSVKIDNNHTVILLKPNGSREIEKVMILGPHN